jgi:hypothetical protein
MVGRVGFEPTTTALKVSFSLIYLGVGAEGKLTQWRCGEKLGLV